MPINPRYARLEELLEEATKMLAEHRPVILAAALACEGMPLPVWVKSTDGTMIWMNREYAARFGVELEQYQSLGDNGFWGMVVAHGFAHNDKQVLITGRPWRGLESLGADGDIEVIKWPLIGEDQTIVGVCGMVLP